MKTLDKAKTGNFDVFMVFSEKLLSAKSSSTDYRCIIVRYDISKMIFFFYTLIFLYT